MFCFLKERNSYFYSSKDALNWSKVTVNPFLMLQKRCPLKILIKNIIGVILYTYRCMALLLAVVLCFSINCIFWRDSAFHYVREFRYWEICLFEEWLTTWELSWSVCVCVCVCVCRFETRVLLDDKSQALSGETWAWGSVWPLSWKTLRVPLAHTHTHL